MIPIYFIYDFFLFILFIDLIFYYTLYSMKFRSLNPVRITVNVTHTAVNVLLVVG